MGLGCRFEGLRLGVVEGFRAWGSELLGLIGRKGAASWARFLHACCVASKEPQREGEESGWVVDLATLLSLGFRSVLNYSIPILCSSILGHYCQRFRGMPVQSLTIPGLPGRVRDQEGRV